MRCVTHFVASLPDGNIFNDTWKRDQPFRFRLGAEEVLEGFDEGVATMREGERGAAEAPALRGLWRPGG